MSGRRRQQPPPQLTVTEPMSKAQRILGSTPLSIDAPPNWDDGCSSASDDRSGSTATSYPDWDARNLYDYHPVGIAKSDNGWGDDSDVLPHPQKLKTPDVGDEAEARRPSVSSLLRKSHSSLTIRSWYDKTKMPLSISQQTSSSAMAKGLPSAKAAKLLDVDDVHGPAKTRRKPGMLDHLSLMPVPRISKKGSQSLKQEDNDPGLSPGLRVKSPFNLSPNSLTRNTPSMQRILRRRTSESLHSDAAESSRPRTSGTNSSSNRWPPQNPALNELPSLYDHYEQMSLREVMRQDPKPDSSLALPVAEKTLSEAQLDDQPQSPRGTKAFDRNYDNASPTAFFTKSLEPSLPANYATSVSSRLTKTSRASTSIEKSFGSTDLQQMSVLMLSSDSEDDGVDDGIVPPSATNKNPMSTAVTRPSYNDNQSPRLGSSRLNKSEHSERSERRLSRSSKSSKSSKRASFAPSNTYITIPGASERSQAPIFDSRSSTHSGHVSQTTNDSGSRRASFMSTYSGNSAMTWQSKSGCSIQEARTVAMVTTRCPPDSELEGKEGAQATQRAELDYSAFNCESISGAAEQLTPPLSPTSVDFYIRSAHSSIDGPGSHNRLMAVTLREEMLLAALRLKQSSLRGNTLSQLAEDDEEDEMDQRTKRESSHQNRQSTEKRSSKASQATVTESPFGFGFPAPPMSSHGSYSGSVKSKSPRNRSSSRQSSDGRRRSSAVLVNGDLQSISSDNSLTPPNDILRKASYDSTAEQLQEEVPVYLDMDPSPGASDFQDWEDAMSLPSDFDSMAWPTPHSGSRRSSVRSASGRHSSLQSDTLALSSEGRLAGVSEETSAEMEEEQGVPRPDSPISPDSFPAVPEKRTTLNNMARLSAVGPGLLGALSSAEMGWWGDDD